MVLRIKTQREVDPLLHRMAKEAGIGVVDLAEVAIYNIVALYCKEHPDALPMADPAVDNVL